MSYVRNGGKIKEATIEAGYVRDHEGYRLIKIPAIIDAIRTEQARLIGCEAATVAIGTIIEVMQDKQAKNSDRLKAAALALEAAQIIKKPKHGQDDRTKGLAEMTVEELERFILASNAKLADISKGNAQDSAQIIDLEPISD